jgi:hypothetical protein
MYRHLTVALAALLAWAVSAPAQESPYVSYQDRSIKALSADEIDALLAGEGMGFALSAELNGYPGPRHVLDFADSLALDGERRRAVQTIFDRTHAEAVRLGTSIVGLEASLDSAFATRRITPSALETALTRIASLRGELRYVHLGAHLEVAALLSVAEIREYQCLRGYAAGHGEHDHQPSP